MRSYNTLFVFVAFFANTSFALPANVRRDTAPGGAIAEIAGIPSPSGGDVPTTASVTTTRTAEVLTTPTPPTTTPSNEEMTNLTNPNDNDNDSPTTTQSEPANTKAPNQTTSEVTGIPESQASAPGQGPAGLTLYQQLVLAPNAVERQALLKDEDMIFKFDDPLRKVGVAAGEGGEIVRADHATFPALVGQGGALAIGFLGPCGFNTPHVHPRAAELNLVIEGHLFANVVNENEARFINHTLGKYEMTVFPQGAVHTEFNPDCTPSVFVAAFPNEDVSFTPEFK